MTWLYCFWPEGKGQSSEKSRGQTRWWQQAGNTNDRDHKFYLKRANNRSYVLLVMLMRRMDDMRQRKANMTLAEAQISMFNLQIKVNSSIQLWHQRCCGQQPRPPPDTLTLLNCCWSEQHQCKLFPWLIKKEHFTFYSCLHAAACTFSIEKQPARMNFPSFPLAPLPRSCQIGPIAYPRCNSFAAVQKQLLKLDLYGRIHMLNLRAFP